jgi:hypothetical protein
MAGSSNEGHDSKESCFADDEYVTYFLGFYFLILIFLSKRPERPNGPYTRQQYRCLSCRLTKLQSNYSVVEADKS